MEPVSVGHCCADDTTNKNVRQPSHVTWLYLTSDPNDGVSGDVGTTEPTNWLAWQSAPRAAIQLNSFKEMHFCHVVYSTTQ